MLNTSYQLLSHIVRCSIALNSGETWAARRRDKARRDSSFAYLYPCTVYCMYLTTLGIIQTWSIWYAIVPCYDEAMIHVVNSLSRIPPCQVPCNLHNLLYQPVNVRTKIHRALAKE
jgi:hypothetical protein